MLLCLLPVMANAIEVEDADGGVWAVMITDNEATVPTVEDLIEAGVLLDSEKAQVTEYETFEEGLVRLSSALAEKMVSILYTWGPESLMGVYQYDGEEGKYAMAAFVPAEKQSSLDALSSFLLVNIECQEMIMSLEEMMEE